MVSSRLVVFLLCIAGLLTTAGFASGTPLYGGTLRYATYDIPGSLDPHNNLGRGLTEQYVAFEKLLEYNEDLELVPMLAESWDVVDAQTYVFNIRQGVTFHDGSILDAAAVAFNFERLQSEYSLNRGQFSIVDNVVIVDDYTVVVELVEAFAPFLDLMASARGYIVSMKAVQENGDEWFQRNPVGTGAFRFDSWNERDGVLQFVKYSDYWQTGKPYLDAVHFIELPDATVRSLSYEAGLIDFVYRVHEDQLERLESLGAVLVPVQAQGNAVTYVMMNTRLSPFDDARVRQAVRFAINRDEILSFLRYAEPIEGPLSPDSWGMNPTVAQKYDPERARELLEAAGYPDGFSAALAIRSGFTLHEKAALVIQQNLQAVGVDVRIEVAESAAMVSRGRAGELPFSIMAYGGGGSFDPNQNLSALFLPEAAFNYMGYDNTDVTGMVEQARVLPNQEARQQLYWDATRIIVEEDVPAVFFAKVVDYSAYDPALRGVRLSPTGFILLTTDVWIDR